MVAGVAGRRPCGAVCVRVHRRQRRLERPGSLLACSRLKQIQKRCFSEKLVSSRSFLPQAAAPPPRVLPASRQAMRTRALRPCPPAGPPTRSQTASRDARAACHWLSSLCPLKLGRVAVTQEAGALGSLQPLPPWAPRAPFTPARLCGVGAGAAAPRCLRHPAKGWWPWPPHGRAPPSKGKSPDPPAAGPQPADVPRQGPPPGGSSAGL